MQYAELHCLTNFSFLQAASHPEECVAQASALGYTAIAITDHASVAGIVRAHTAAQEHGMQLIVGAEIRPVDGWPVVLWAQNRRGYANLCHLITKGCRRTTKGDCEIFLDEVAEHSAGLLAGVIPPADGDGDRSEPKQAASPATYRDIFADSAHLLLELHRGLHDNRRVEQVLSLSERFGLPPVAAGGVLFHVPERKPLHDVLTAIRHHTTVPGAIAHLRPNAEQHLRPTQILKQIFSAVPDAVQRTVEIASQCRFNLDQLRYEYPDELAPEGMTPLQHLEQLTWQGARRRYPQGIPPSVHKLICHELQLIGDLQYEPYFLTVYDLVKFARSRQILCQGRGSAANSVVCYCLEVTSVDPKQINLLFERFVSRERDEVPDIDVDFEHERREEILQYLYEKYGRDRAGMTAVTTTYRTRSAIRDVGKALGFSLDLVDRLAKNASRWGASEDASKRLAEVGLNLRSRTGKQFQHLVGQLVGFPRHLSQHVGGMIITRGPLHELVPIENAAMADRTVVQWNKDDIDALGILKVDCLALGMLTAIRKCFAMVQDKTGSELTLANIPPDDQATYDMICRADTIGVFQIESRAQMSMLPRLQPRCYYDLVIEVAIVRPGPIQGDMVHPYLRRRKGEEKPTYPDDAIEEVLKRTLGVPLFQEQCMQLAIVAAGFTPGEADQLRRAMGAWRRPGLIDQFHQKLLTGMEQKGFSKEFSERVFQQIRGFGEYGFPESHAASFALLVYVSAWLKCHHPAEFAAALINSQPMGFYAPAQLIQDARQHSASVLPIDINHSDWDCTIERGALRLGFRLISGFQQSVARAIVSARGKTPFASMHDLVQRTGITQPVAILLAQADAISHLNGSRRQSLWHALDVKSASVPAQSSNQSSTQLSLLDHLDPEPETSVELPAMSDEEETHADYRSYGLSLRAHPMVFRRPALDQLGARTIEQVNRCRNGTWVKTSGIVLLRQRPHTAKGITFATIEDETGTANLVIHQTVWKRYRATARHRQVWIVSGRLESKDGVVHLITRRIDDFTDESSSLQLPSRDFR